MILEGLNPYNCNRKCEVFINMTMFEHAWAILFAQCVNFKEKSVLWKEKTNLEIQEDLNDIFNRVFRFWDYQGKREELQKFSHYYKDIYENVENYVYPQEEFSQILKYLKSQGKFLFIGSNSPYPYAKLTLDHSLGKVSFKKYLNYCFF